MLPRTTGPPPDPFRTGYHLSPSVPVALDHLHHLADGIAILTCYAHYFPAQWAASQTPWTLDPQCAWAAREWEFFRLVDTHLFPLSLEWLEMLDADGREGRQLALPIERGGLDWWDCEPGDFGPAWDLLLWLSGAWLGEKSPDDEPEDDEPEDDAEPPDATPADAVTADPHLLTPAATAAARLAALLGRPVEKERLDQAAAAAGPPLSHLPAALALIAHETGSAWLDSGPENEMDLYWNIADMAVMIDDYQIGQGIDAATRELVTWLDHPAHRVQLLDLWAGCLTTPPVVAAAP